MPTFFANPARVLLALPVAWLACSEPFDDGLRKCDGGLCVEIFRGFYTTEPCAGAPDQSCTYVNVFFVLERGDASVNDLTADRVAMRIEDRDVGVEGDAELTQENGLLVTLLLDRSYSITEAGTTDAVRDAAKGFIATLPDEAVVGVATFASEASVPVLLESGAEKSGMIYLPVATARAQLEAIIDDRYQPYEAQSSVAFTKLYDAVGYLADLRPADASLSAMQSVGIVFTDGADTASSTYTTPEAALEHIAAVAPDMKIYTVGLGDEVDRDALSVLGEGRTYLAAGGEQLEDAFAAVANDLGAIYQLRILVAEQEYDATASLSISYGGRDLETSFVLLSLDPGSASGADDRLDDATGGDASGDASGGESFGSLTAVSSTSPVEPSPTCQQPCFDAAGCSLGEACLSTTEGNKCLPIECQSCFDAALVCTSLTDTCAFESCHP